MPESQVTGAGTLTSTWQDGLTGAWTDFLEGFNGGTTPMVLLHGAGSPISVPTPLTAMQCQLQVATQRRRNRR
jgi:hypothetical protein